MLWLNPLQKLVAMGSTKALMSINSCLLKFVDGFFNVFLYCFHIAGIPGELLLVLPVFV